MSEALSKAPEQCISMRAAGANAQEVFKKARSDGYKSLDCAFIITGLFELSLHEARQIGVLLDKDSGDLPKLT